MSGHHGVGEGRPAPPPTRPRYGRLGAAGSAATVTLVAVLGGLGLIPVGQDPAAASSAREHHPASAGGAPSGDREGAQSSGHLRQTALPAHSGRGRRVVFAMSAQRVWLVDRSAGADVVRRTYLVSGSVTDNLKPGTYEVYSKSPRAWGIDDSGTMRYMVRFAHGPRAAIGFHDIPELDGRKVQTRAELGTPRSHGCIRQWRPDARALWRFAPVGTKVVVVA